MSWERRNGTTLRQERRARERMVYVATMAPKMLVCDSRGRAYVVADVPNRFSGANAGLRTLSKDQIEEGRKLKIIPKQFVSEYD